MPWRLPVVDRLAGCVNLTGNLDGILILTLLLANVTQENGAKAHNTLFIGHQTLLKAAAAEEEPLICLISQSFDGSARAAVRGERPASVLNPGAHEQR